MEFTFHSYQYLVDMLVSHGYVFCNYQNHNRLGKTVIMRHDVDFDVKKALEFAQYEKEMGVTATYFFLISSNFYNIYSAENSRTIEKIKDCGHEIGLHYDEKRYQDNTPEKMAEQIKKEICILEQCVSFPIRAVSMHRPSPSALTLAPDLDGIRNSYGEEFFKNYKYASDSRMNWREDILGMVGREEYKRLHILTHPFWYSSGTETMEEKLTRFVKDARRERFSELNQNFSHLEEVLMGTGEG